MTDQIKKKQLKKKQRGFTTRLRSLRAKGKIAYSPTQLADFADELKKLRTQGEIRYSQSQLAELAGVTASYISHLENRLKNPTPAVIRKLSRHLAVSPNHLLRKLGMVEMDLAGTIASNFKYANQVNPGLSTEQLEELANYLTYLDFKAKALK